MAKYIILSITITFSGASLIYLLLTLSPYLIYLSYILVILIPTMLFILLLTSINNIKGKYAEFEFILEFVLVMVFVFNVLEFEIFFLKIVSFNLTVLLLAIGVSSLVTIISYSRIRKLLEEIEKIF